MRKIKKLPEQELQELKLLFNNIKDSLKDNKQNMRDCLLLIQKLEKNLEIEDDKPTLFQKIRTLLSTK